MSNGSGRYAVKPFPITRERWTKISVRSSLVANIFKLFIFDCDPRPTLIIAALLPMIFARLEKTTPQRSDCVGVGKLPNLAPCQVVNSPMLHSCLFVMFDCCDDGPLAISKGNPTVYSRLLITDTSSFELRRR